MIPDHSIVPVVSASDRFLQSCQLIDVRTEDAFQEAHLPGSRNFCVYETVFMEKIAQAFPDKTKSLLLVGEGGEFQAAQVAWARLHSAGYTEVKVLKGGVSAWRALGKGLEEHPFPVKSLEGTYTLEPEACRIHWIGRNLLNQHSGTIAARSGDLRLDSSGNPIEGSVAVDMTRIHCEDLNEAGMAGMLVQHLQSVDFFAVSEYPLAEFRFYNLSPLAGATPGTPNCRIQGILTARGREMTLDIDALVAETEDGIVLKAVFDFDRTEVGAVYGSGRFFERLGMHLVQDRVSMDVRCVFRES